jgi:hypothetical protein
VVEHPPGIPEPSATCAAIASWVVATGAVVGNAYVPTITFTDTNGLRRLRVGHNQPEPAL